MYPYNSDYLIIKHILSNFRSLKSQLLISYYGKTEKKEQVTRVIFTLLTFRKKAEKSTEIK